MTVARQYRKKPVVVEAARVRDLMSAFHNPSSLPIWIKEAYEAGKVLFSMSVISIHTEEGVMSGQMDDMIIRGVKGKLYPCKPDIFEETYELLPVPPKPADVPNTIRHALDLPSNEETIAAAKQKVAPRRLVMYNHPGSLDGKHKPMQSPALIQRLNEDGSVFLWVFGPYGISFNPSIQYGTGPSQWQWTERS